MLKFLNLTALISFSVCLLTHQAAAKDEEHHGIDVFPGIQVRLVEEVTELIRDDLLQYATAYVNWDLNWPNSTVHHVAAFPFYFDLYIDSLSHDLVRADLSKFKFDFLQTWQDRNNSVLLFEVPLLEDWNIESTYHY